MKHFLRIAALLALFAFPVTEAKAVACGTGSGTCFGIATGNWVQGASWSDTSGGATCSATCTVGPVAGDTVTLDSGFNTKTMTISAAAAAGTFTTTCTSCTLAHSAFSFTISGNTFTLGSGLTYAPAAGRTITFTSTTGTSGTPTAITLNGQTVGNLTFNGAAGYFQFQSDVPSQNTSTFTVTAGTLDTNGFAVSVGSTVVSASQTLKLGGSTYTISSVGSVTPWTMSGTLTANTSTINISPSATVTGQLSFTGGAQTYNIVNVGIGSSAAVGFGVSFSGSNTFNELNITGPRNVAFTAGTTQTINSATAVSTWTGTATTPILVSTVSITGSDAIATIALTGSSAASTGTWVAINGITFTSANSASMAISNCLNLGANTFPGGSSCTAPSTGGGGRIIGG